MHDLSQGDARAFGIGADQFNFGVIPLGRLAAVWTVEELVALFAHDFT